VLCFGNIFFIHLSLPTPTGLAHCLRYRTNSKAVFQAIKKLLEQDKPSQGAGGDTPLSGNRG
ncbi:MAG: hypothetical protein WDA33_09590, partial [Alcaligenes sp.]